MKKIVGFFDAIVDAIGKLLSVYRGSPETDSEELCPNCGLPLYDEKNRQVHDIYMCTRAAMLRTTD